MKIQIQTVIFQNDIKVIKRWLESVVANVMSLDDSSISVKISIGINESDTKRLRNISRVLSQVPASIDRSVTLFGSNLGHGQAHNALALTTNHDLLWIINPDGIPDIDCLGNLVRSLNSNPDVAVVEARQVPFDHPKQFNSETLETSWVSGACFLIKSSHFKEVAGFDSMFFLHGDDVDLSWRLREKGRILKFLPSAIFYHDKLISENGYPSLSSAEAIYGPLGALLVAFRFGLKAGLREMIADLKHGDQVRYRIISEMFRHTTEGEEFGEFRNSRVAKYYSPWSFSKNRF
jgi:GT2 family glycosyltransferase